MGRDGSDAVDGRTDAAAASPRDGVGVGRADAEPARADGGVAPGDRPDDLRAGGTDDRHAGEADVDSLLDELEDLERAVDDPDERERVRRTIRLARRIPGNGLLGTQVQKYTTRDIAETFVGSILISLPMLVEDGIYDIGDHFAANPAFFAANALFVVVMTIGLLYWADIQDVQITNPILGIVPRRLVGVLTIAAVTAIFTMTLWGRIDWADPWRTVCYVSVVWSAAAFGGGLGDILPGESEGTDIGEEWD